MMMSFAEIRATIEMIGGSGSNPGEASDAGASL
jgi:hypothetical protein